MKGRRCELDKRTWVSLDSELLTRLLSDTVGVNFGDLDVASRGVGVGQFLPDGRKVLEERREGEVSISSGSFLQIPTGKRSDSSSIASQHI